MSNIQDYYHNQDNKKFNNFIFKNNLYVMKFIKCPQDHFAQTNLHTLGTPKCKRRAWT